MIIYEKDSNTQAIHIEKKRNTNSLSFFQERQNDETKTNGYAAQSTAEDIDSDNKTTNFQKSSQDLNGIEEDYDENSAFPFKSSSKQPQLHSTLLEGNLEYILC